MGDERRTRKVRVDDRLAIAVAAIAGVVAALSSASPTGDAAVDAGLIAISVGVVTWAAASAPWWTIAALAGVATAFAADVLLIVIGVISFIAALWIGRQRRDLSTARAATTGVALNVLIRAEATFGLLGTTAVVGIASALCVLVLGLRRRHERVGRPVMWVLIGIGAIGVVVCVVFGVAALDARRDLTNGHRLARAGIESLNDGDYERAADQFGDAAVAFSAADDTLAAEWVQPAQLVPVVAQNRRAAAELADAAADVSGDLEDALLFIDPEQLTIESGRFDLDVIAGMQGPLSDLQQSVTDLQATMDDVDSPWLVEPIQERMTELEAELDDNKPRLDTATQAIQIAPALLGGDGVRRYFVAFTTPAEARGQGGFMGNWGVITADQGRLTLSDFGRTKQLNDAPGTRTVSGPDEWTELWGRYGFTNGPDGSTGDVPWSNITMSPHFPSTAQVIAELYPQSGGTPVDGVFAMDPFVLQALLGFSGPISVEGSDIRLDEDNLAQFLLTDQYELDQGGREDLLEQVAFQTIDQTLGGSLPNPTVLARQLGPLADEGRLVGWSADPEEQALFETVSLSGELPDLDGGDGIAVVLNNAGANKLDVFLERDISYSAEVDPSTGQVEATAVVTLTNNAPSSGLPDGVIGNYTGDAPGTNRTLFSLYSALTPIDAEVDGTPFTFDVGSEEGWNVAKSFLAVPPGESITVTYRLSGTLAMPDGYTLSTRPQPLVLDETLHVDVTSDTGEVLVSEDLR